MTALADLHLVVHLFAPLDGPAADDAYADVVAVWAGCRRVFSMLDAVAETGLPHHLPASRSALPAAAGPIEELAVAAQEAAGSDDQAILRRHYDVVNLSALVAGADWSDADQRWSAIARPDQLLGEVRVHVARLVEGSIAGLGTSAVGTLARAALPPVPEAPAWWQHGVLIAPGLAVWEVSPRDDLRSARRFVAVADPGTIGPATVDPAAIDPADRLSAWLWSQGGTAMPPFARYLLHAVKLRYQLRVFTREAPALKEARDPLYAATRVVEMRRTVEIAASNLAVALGETPVAGPFAEDRRLAEWFATRLADEEVYLEAAARRAPPAAAPSPATVVAPTVVAADVVARAVEASPAVDITRNVFVVHGRDGQVRDAMFGFLKDLDLHPLEWESLVAFTGSAAPYLGDVVANAVRMAQAVVVLLTPDDVVQLHPRLHLANDLEFETRPIMQPRPNVLIELGMALALYPRRTILVQVGRIRPFADTDGRNYIVLNGTTTPLRKIATRLKNAGCAVKDHGTDWLKLDRFTGLDAYTRSPDN